jgi:rhomboid protease GluP
VAGFVFGAVAWLVPFFGGRLTEAFVQANWLVYHGWYWQLLTSLVVVFPSLLGVEDALFNAVAVLWLDGLLSDAFSSREYYVVFVASGVVGNLLSLLNGPNEVSFGASGGIFGLLAGAVVLDHATQHRMNYQLLGWFLLIFIISSFGLTSVDWAAHLGGAVFGLAAGYALRNRHRADSL